MNDETNAEVETSPLAEDLQEHDSHDDNFRRFEAQLHSAVHDLVKYSQDNPLNVERRQRQAIKQIGADGKQLNLGRNRFSSSGTI